MRKGTDFMFRGYYIAANGMINQQRVINTTTNNMANSQTAGFKRDTNIPTTFERKLVLLRNQNNKTGTIEYRSFEQTNTSLEQGSFEYTSSKLDVALKGNVYFNIQPKSQLYKDDGETLMTRKGQFNIDDEGFLALGSAGRVMGSDGPIQIGTSDFAIDEKGKITTADGREFQLKLSYINSSTDVLKKGDNMFALSQAATDANVSTEIPAGEDYSVIQGAYERSNVDAGEEMTKVMAAQSNFKSCSQMLQMFDTINQKTSSELGKA